MPEKLSIGFIGAGKMATALAKGFIRAGLVSPSDLSASDPNETARSAFYKETKVQPGISNTEVVAAARIIFLAVKPGQTSEVLSDLRESWRGHHLLLS